MKRSAHQLMVPAVLIADGGRVLSDLATFEIRPELFGPVASDLTLWRALSEIGQTQQRKIARARENELGGIRSRG